MTRQHAKKSIPWREDPDILQRLELVANLMIQGAKTHQIATSLGSPHRTTSRDMARVRELWRTQSEQTIEDKRAASIARYDEILTRLWKEYRKIEGEGKSTVKVLLAIATVEAEKTKIEGTRITNIDLTSKGEKIQDARGWSDDQLAGLL